MNNYPTESRQIVLTNPFNEILARTIHQFGRTTTHRSLKIEDSHFTDAVVAELGDTGLFIVHLTSTRWHRPTSDGSILQVVSPVDLPARSGGHRLQYGKRTVLLPDLTDPYRVTHLLISTNLFPCSVGSVMSQMTDAGPLEPRIETHPMRRMDLTSPVDRLLIQVFTYVGYQVSLYSDGGLSVGHESSWNDPEYKSLHRAPVLVS